MPTKNEKPNIYITNQGGELHEINQIEHIKIEKDSDSQQDFSKLTEPFEMSWKVSKTPFHKLMQISFPNNWLKRHGFPMRRKFKK